MKSVLLISHGSHSPETKKEVENVVEALKEKSTIPIFEYAFLEIEKPSIPDGIERCVERGATQITILLNFLNSGKHVDFDIPNIIRTAKEKYPQIQFKITKPLLHHNDIIDIFIGLIDGNN